MKPYAPKPRLAKQFREKPEFLKERAAKLRSRLERASIDPGSRVEINKAGNVAKSKPDIPVERAQRIQRKLGVIKDVAKSENVSLPSPQKNFGQVRSAFVHARNFQRKSMRASMSPANTAFGRSGSKLSKQMFPGQRKKSKRIHGGF